MFFNTVAGVNTPVTEKAGSRAGLFENGIARARSPESLNRALAGVGIKLGWPMTLQNQIIDYSQIKF